MTLTETIVFLFVDTSLTVMVRFNFILAVFGLVLLSCAAFAVGDCSVTAYRQACASCSFDAQGKMDQECYSAKKASGTACMSATYPIMSGKYATGACPQVDECASELSSCINQYATGNDKADCQEGSTAVCFAAADQCVQGAAFKCGEVEKQCGLTNFILLAGLLGVGFAGLTGKTGKW
jgi:hypothetical protein